eukprot:gene37472-42441_t
MEVAAFRHEIHHGAAAGMSRRWRRLDEAALFALSLRLALVDPRTANLVGMGERLERLQILLQDAEPRTRVHEMVGNHMDDTMGLLQPSPQEDEPGAHDDGTI